MKIKTIAQCSSLCLALATSLSAEVSPVQPKPTEIKPAKPSAELATLKFSAPKMLGIPFKQLEAATFVDYDGDGATDIISGNYGGNIFFRKNTGTNVKPAYAAAVKLKQNDKAIKLTHW